MLWVCRVVASFFVFLKLVITTKSAKGFFFLFIYEMFEYIHIVVTLCDFLSFVFSVPANST